MSRDTKMNLSRKGAVEYLIEKTNLRKNILNSEVYSGLKLNSEQVTQIAGLHNGLKDLIPTLENTIMVMGGAKKEPTKATFLDDSKIGSNIISRLNSYKFFDSLAGDLSNITKSQTGSKLIDNVVKMNKVAYNRTTKSGMVDFQRVYTSSKNFSNILEKGGQIISYDLETLGGVNSYGHQQNDFITELSAVVYDVNPGEVIDYSKPSSHSINSVLGFSDKEYNDIKSYIEGLRDKSPSELTSKDNVYLDRLSRMNDSKLDISINGFEHRIQHSSKPEELAVSVDDALKGLEKYREIGKAQEAFSGVTGTAFEAYKKNYIRQYRDLVYKGMTTDGTKLSNHISIAHNSSVFDDKFLGTILSESVEHEAGRNLDSYQAVKYVQEFLGQSAHLPNKYKATKDFGLGAQDQLKAMLKLDGGDVAAHNAFEDAKTLVQILTDPRMTVGNRKMSYGQFLTERIHEVNGKLNNLKNVHQFNSLTGSQGVFYMNRTAQKDWGVNKNGLSFTYNPLDRSYKTFDGFRVQEDGNVAKEGFNGFGPKSNALYTHEAYKIDLNKEDWKKQFGTDMPEKFYEEYATSDYLYVLKSQEYIDGFTNTKKFGENNALAMPPTHVQLFKTEEELASAMGVKVATVKDGNLSFINNALDGLNLKTTEYDANGNVVVKDVTNKDAEKMLLDRSAYRTGVDSAGRTIREMEYERVAKFARYKQLNHLSVSQQISKMVSNNQTLSQSVTQNLIDDLGWYDTASKTNKILPETVAKANVIDQYAEALNPLLTAMDDVFEEMGMPDSFSSVEKEGMHVISGTTDKALKAKKNIMFQNVMTNVLETLSNDPAVIGQAKPTIFTADELNKIDFLRSDLFPEVEARQMGRGVVNSNAKYVSLDLTKNDALLNMFYNNTYAKRDIAKKGNAGFDSLFRAYEAIGTDSRFQGVWGKLGKKDLLKYQQEGNLSQLNSIMLGKLQSFVNDKRISNSGFGLSNARFVQDYSDVRGMKNLLGGTDYNHLKDLVREQMKSSVDNVYIANENSSSLLDDVVNKYFMTFSESDFKKSLSGLTKDQQNILGIQYKLAKDQAYSSAKDLVNSVKGTNINFGIHGSGTNATLFLQRGNEIQSLDMHQYTMHNGIITHRINGNDYATNFSYDVNGLINRQGKVRENVKLMDGIKISSNVQEALGRTYSLESAVKYARQGQQDIFDAIVFKVRKNAGILREVGARRENFNYNNTIERAMQINTNSIISVLPELLNDKHLESIEKDFNIDSKSREGIRNLIDKIKDAKSRPREVSDLLASEQNLFYQVYHQPILEYINKNANLGDAGFVTKTINGHVQDTKYAEGKLTVNNSPFSHGAAKFDPTTRSVANQQGNAILYSRNKMAQDLAEHAAGRDLKIGGRLMTGASNKFINHAGDQTAGLTMRYLQIDSHNLRNIFIDDVEKVRNGQSNRFSKFLGEHYKGTKVNVDEASKILAERAMKLSTYEQQSAINARTSYVAFSKNNSQIINSKKELIIAHTENLSVIESTKHAHKLPVVIRNGKIEYQIGSDVTKGEVLGVFGSETNTVKSRFNGVFRGRYFDRATDQIISEAELNKSIAGLGNKSDKAIRAHLDSLYDFKYQVINKFEDYGHKLYNDASEKSTADVMDIALGRIDKGLVSELDKRGFKGLGGRVLSKEYIEEVLTPQLDKNIVDRILKERFAFSDALSMFDELKDVDQITNLNVIKHESVSMGLTNVVEKLNRDPEASKNLNKYYDALFGKGKYSLTKDGTILMDSVESLTVKGFDKNYGQHGLTKEQGDLLQNILDKQEWVEDAKGNRIGHKGYSYVTHAYDDPSGTYSSNSNLSELQRDYSRLRGELDRTSDPGTRAKLTSEMTSIENEIQKLDTQKGLKFDNRMNLNLQRAVYDNDSIMLAKSNLSEEEFSKFFGHALTEDGKLSKEFLGQSVLNPVTSIMRDRTLIGFGETKLSDVAKDKRYGYLIDSYGNMADKISVEKAEKAYSYQQGVKALSFNHNRYSQSAFEQLTEGATHDYNKFKMVDLSTASVHDHSKWLDLDIGGQGRTVTSAANNPYTKNLMIKTGLGGEHEYLAIARMPELHFEDSLIKKNHVQKLNDLQRAIQQINGGEVKGKKLDEIRDYARRVYDDIVAAQKQDLTSKTGLYGDLISSRLSESFFGKASGLTINSNLSLNELKANSKLGYEHLQKMNASTFLDTAQFEGKSLLQHYSEGKVIDAVGVSRQAFEDMGYFKDDTIKKVFGENGTVKQMEEHLAKHGDSFLATRFPRIQEASDKVVMGYLDPTLKGNQIMALGHTGASMNLDHDGDIFAVARITNEKGESMLNYKASGAEDDLFIKSQKAMMMERAVNINTYWDSKIRTKIGKEFEVGTLGSSLEKIANKQIIDNKIISAIMDTRDMSQKDMNNLLTEYGDFVTEAMKSGSHEGVLQKIQKQGLDKQKYITAYSYQKLKDEAIAKSAKNSIGEINVTNYKIKDAAMSVMDKTAENYSYKSRLMYDIMHQSEQAAISSKSSIEGLDPDRAKVWNENAVNYITRKGDAQEQLKTITDWTDKYLVGELDPHMYWSSSSQFRQVVADTFNNGKSLTTSAFNDLMGNKSNVATLQKRMVGDFVETMDSLRNKSDDVKSMLRHLSLGHSTTGVTTGIDNPIINDNFENPGDRFTKLMENSAEDLRNNLTVTHLNGSVKESIFSKPNLIDKVVSNSEELAEEKGIGRKILEGAHDVFKEVSGSKIAMGAVGIAAGVMMLGYVGGRPRPAQTQAMEEAQDYQEPQQGLMDPGMMPMNMAGSSQQSGYVVNINARSDKGRNHAISAIQQAISSGTSSSVNISMNINDNYGNISDRDIQKAIKDAF